MDVQQSIGFKKNMLVTVIFVISLGFRKNLSVGSHTSLNSGSVLSVL